MKASLLTSLTAALQDNIAHLLSKLEVQLSAAAVDIRRQFNTELTSAKRKRFLRYLVLVGAGWLCGFLGYFGYVHFNMEVPPRVFTEISWHLVGDTIFAIGGFFVARWFDNFPRRSRQIRNDFEVLLRREINRITEDVLQAHSFAAIEQTNLTERLSRAYLDIVKSDPDGWQQSAAERLSQLARMDGKYREVRFAYSNLVEEFCNSVSGYFSDASRNLELLNDVAKRIKADAIEPSFSLLEQTRGSLDTVKKDMHSVEFTPV